MNDPAPRESSVLIIGGGYGGIALAKALDEHAAVTLVEPRDAFVHNIAALRAVVRPGFLHRMFLPYDHLLARGRVVRDRAVRVDGRGRTKRSSSWTRLNRSCQDPTTSGSGMSSTGNCGTSG